LTLGTRLEPPSIAFAGLLPSFVAIIHLLEFDLIFYFPFGFVRAWCEDAALRA
jgi:hypothetical protein